MRLSIKALAVTGAILWGGSVFLAGVGNIIWPSYAGAVLQLIDSIYPGYHASGSFGSVIIATLYGTLDGAAGGFLFGWMYNCFAAKFESAENQEAVPVQPE